MIYRSQWLFFDQRFWHQVELSNGEERSVLAVQEQLVQFVICRKKATKGMGTENSDYKKIVNV